MMKWNIWWVMFFVLLLNISCKPPFPEGEELNKTVIIEDRIFPSSMDSLFQAHGGLEKWKELGTLQFHVSSDFHPFGNEVHIVDIVSRSIFINNEQFNLGYNGREYWISPGLSFAKELDVLAYKDMMYYLLAFPFVMADLAIQCGEPKFLEKDGSRYICIECHDTSGIEEFHDLYTLYLHPQKYTLEWIEYTPKNDEMAVDGKRLILKFKDWQTHRGLKLPGVIRAQDTNENTLFSVRFSEIVLQEERPDTSLFTSTEVRDVIR